MLIFNAPKPDAGLGGGLHLCVSQSEPHTAVHYRLGGLIDQCRDLSPNWVLMMPISLSMAFLLSFSARGMSLSIWMASRVASLMPLLDISLGRLSIASMASISTGIGITFLSSSAQIVQPLCGQPALPSGIPACH